jgi:hypothetical protein
LVFISISTLISKNGIAKEEKRKKITVIGFENEVVNVAEGGV